MKEENQVEYQAKTLIQAMHIVLSALSIPEEIYQNETNLVHLVELMAMGLNLGNSNEENNDLPGNLVIDNPSPDVEVPGNNPSNP